MQLFQFVGIETKQGADAPEFHFVCNLNGPYSYMSVSLEQMKEAVATDDRAREAIYEAKYGEHVAAKDIPYAKSISLEEYDPFPFRGGVSAFRGVLQGIEKQGLDAFVASNQASAEVVTALEVDRNPSFIGYTSLALKDGNFVVCALDPDGFVKKKEAAEIELRHIFALYQGFATGKTDSELKESGAKFTTMLDENNDLPEGVVARLNLPGRDPIEVQQPNQWETRQVNGQELASLADHWDMVAKVASSGLLPGSSWSISRAKAYAELAQKNATSLREPFIGSQSGAKPAPATI